MSIFTSRVIALLQSKGNEISAHFKLIINMLIYLLMSEKFQNLLLISLDLVDNWDQKD